MSTRMQLQWRRAKTLELSSKGYGQVEIASQLQVNEVTVSRDMAYLRKQALDNLQHHIHEKIPEEYQSCMFGMKQNLKQTLEIAETAADPKTKLQARAIANDCYKYIMDLCTNASIISDAMKFVNQKTEQLDSLKLKTIDATATEKEGLNENVQTETETNGVF